MNRQSVLSALEALIEADVAAAGGDACAGLLGLARDVRGRVDAIEAQIGSRLRQLHDTEGGAPVADLHKEFAACEPDVPPGRAPGRRRRRRAAA